MLRVLVVAGILLVATAVPTVAQDAAEVDPGHYTVEFENDEVRVLRITYGPGEKSVMHGHSEGVVVFLTDAHVRFTLPDGESQEVTVKGGTTQWVDAGQHQPENLGDEPLEVIQIEFTEKPAKDVPKKEK